MAPLIAILASVLPAALPALGRLIAGETGAAIGQTAQKTVQEVLENVVGTSDEATVRAALADPEKAGLVLVQLNTLAAQRERQNLEAKIEMAKLDNASQDSAQKQMQQLTTLGSAMAWGAPVVSLLVLSCYAVVSYFTMTVVMPEGSQQIVIGLHESLKGLAAIVVGFWVGSSRSSALKDEQRTLGALAPAAHAATAQVAVPVVRGAPDETAESLNNRLGGLRGS